MRAIENAAINDVYADGIDHLDIIGNGQIVRIVYFTWENGEKVITAKVVRPLATFNRKLEELVEEAKARAADLIHINDLSLMH